MALLRDDDDITVRPGGTFSSLTRPLFLLLRDTKDRPDCLYLRFSSPFIGSHLQTSESLRRWWFTTGISIDIHDRKLI